MNDVAYQASVQKMADHFAPKTLVTRPEVLDYQMGGGYVPTKFWTLNRVYRGVFSLNTDVDQIQEQTAVTNMTQSVSPNAAPVEEIVDTSMVSHFFAEAFIPTKDQHFVEWGNFGVVNKLINTNKFFTLFVTGDHGTGKDVMISQACALANRPMVRVQITRDTKEDHLIGTKTLVNGTIRYEEGPVVWCALNAGILVLNELDCLHESETVRIGTVDSWVATPLNQLERDTKYQIVSFNQETHEFENDTGFIIKDGTKDDLYEVELEDGRKVVVTSDHPFIVAIDGVAGEKRITTGLSVSDEVVVMG